MPERNSIYLYFLSPELDPWCCLLGSGGRARLGFQASASGLISQLTQSGQNSQAVQALSSGQGGQESDLRQESRGLFRY